MKTTHTHTVARFALVAMVVTGMSFTSIGATSFANAQVVRTHDGTEDSVWRGKKTQGPQLHQAAMPAWQAQEHAARTLFAGMLLILGAFLLYVVYVVRMEEQEGRKTAWRRFVRWFERKLDVPIRRRG